MKKWMILMMGIGLFFLTGVLGCATTATGPANSAGLAGIPLPQDIKIIPPGPEIPSPLAKCSGSWLGTWTNSGYVGSLDSALVVEEIKPSGAQVVYAQGKEPYWRVEEGWERVNYNLKNGKLVRKRKGSRIELTYNEKEDVIEGIYIPHNAAWKNRITYRRVQLLTER